MYKCTTEGFDIGYRVKQRTGRIIWPDGTITDPDKHVGRFVEYEESDLEWMISLGSAKYEEDYIGVLMSPIRMEMGPMMLDNRRHIFFGEV